MVNTGDGGVGKSTTAHALSAGLAFKGYKVLAIDLDQQQNLTMSVGLVDYEYSIFDLLMQKIDTVKALKSTGQFATIPAFGELKQ